MDTTRFIFDTEKNVSVARQKCCSRYFTRPNMDYQKESHPKTPCKSSRAFPPPTNSFIITPPRHPIHYRPQTKFAKVMFLQVSVCPQGGVACVVAQRGGMRGFIRGGCAWFYLGGRAWFYLGGMRGFIRGGRAWFYSGGVHGFIRGACVVLFGGCMVLFGGVVLFGGACVVLFGGHAWFYSGGHAWFYLGGRAWFFQFFQIQ